MHIKKSLASRKFIDLIHQTSSKWANWSPSHGVEVGDYGKIDKESGEFVRQGNIYQDIQELCKDETTIKLVLEHRPEHAARENVFSVVTDKVKCVDLQSTTGIQVPGLADASIKGQWVFGSGRGALLIMAHPRSSRLPPDVLLDRLADIKKLKNMCLVTEVISCPAYSIYLSSKSSESVDLALLGSFPVPHAPGATATNNTVVKWWSQNASGFFRAGDASGRDEYKPLFTLKEVFKRKGFLRDGRLPPPDPTGDDRWSIVQVPWEPLDEDGEEDQFEDTIFD